MFGNDSKNAELATDVNEEAMVRGRSLLRDARDRFVKNKAAMGSVILLALIALFTIFGPFFAQYSNEEIDWARMGDLVNQGRPSVENGHYFGLDYLGRDLYSRVIQATTISLLVGVIGAAMALIVGTLCHGSFGNLSFESVGKINIESTRRFTNDWQTSSL